jgi:branched-chain amino acid transport system permease protein
VSIPSEWQPIWVAVTVNAMLALGLYVTLMSGQISAGHAALAGIAAYASAILTTNFHWPFLPSLAVGLLLAALTGGLLALATLRMSHFVQSLATLGFGETASLLAFNSQYVGAANSFVGIPLYTTYIGSTVALVLVLYIVWGFERSPIALAARAVRDNPLAAAAAGVNVNAVKVICFAFGGALAGLGGGLSAHYTLLVNPGDLGFFPSYGILVFVLVGGSYTFAGPVLGASVLTVLPQMLRFTIPFRFALYGAAIVLTILLRPEGLLVRHAAGRPGGPLARLESLLNLVRKSRAPSRVRPSDPEQDRPEDAVSGDNYS